MFNIKEAAYQNLIKTAIKVRNMQQDPEVSALNLFTYRNELPTISELKENGIVPESSCVMDENILAYLIYYAETEILDKDGDDWEYIFVPEKKYFTPAEIKEFYETRKYIEKILQKCVKRV